jgi:tRNA A64-2'-O-ribosylphosphate transferase
MEPAGGGHGGAGFGTASANKMLRQVQRAEATSILNHLRSIADDAMFVDGVMDACPPAVPVFANLRCGPWYLRPRPTSGGAGAQASGEVGAPALCQAAAAAETPTASFCRPTGTCYFKSTDGHAGNWAFSWTRPNLHVAVQAACAGGAVVVDTTRGGKRFPDALTKTVPIWCAVLNTVVFGNKGGEDGCGAGPVRLPGWLPASERDQISALVPRFAAGLPEDVRASIRSALAGMLTGPLVPVWVCQPAASDGGARASTVAGTAGGVGNSLPWSAGFKGAALPVGAVPILCLSASRFVEARGDAPSAHEGWRYIQGAADDAEGWSRGLTAHAFWQHAAALLACKSEEACREVLAAEALGWWGGRGRDASSSLGASPGAVTGGAAADSGTASALAGAIASAG